MNTPWIQKKTLKTKNRNLALELEINDFYEYIRPSESAQKPRLEAFSFLKNFFETKIKDSRLFLFGSSAIDLYLPGADLDIALISEACTGRILFLKASQIIRKNYRLFENIEIISSAKVPIIKFVLREFGFHCDICFNHEGGLKAIEFNKKALLKYPTLAPLLLLFKLFLRQRRFHMSYKGGIGSYLLFCMILHFLEYYPSLVELKYGRLAMQKINLVQYLLGFLKYYGSEFDHINDEITIEGTTTLVRQKDAPEEFFRVVHLDEDRWDLGSGSFRCQEIFDVFFDRFMVLKQQEHEAGQSILRHLINPRNLDFKIYEKY